MVFTRQSTGKIWSSICMQDIVIPGLYYHINLIRLISLFANAAIGWNPWDVFAKNFILDLLLGSEYASRTSKVKCNWKLKIMLYVKVQGKVNTYSKVKSKYCKKDAVSCKRMQKLVWLNSSISCSEMFQNRTALTFIRKHLWWRSLLSTFTACSMKRYFHDKHHADIFLIISGNPTHWATLTSCPLI